MQPWQRRQVAASSGQPCRSPTCLSDVPCRNPDMLPLRPQQALVQLCSGKALLEQPVAAGTRRAARSVTVAAAGRPQQRPGNGPRQQQDVSHQHDFDTIRREWHVRRTELRHFPEEVQERIRGGSPGGTSGTSGGRAASGVQRSAAHTSSGRPAQPQGSSTGDGADSDVSPAADTGSGRAGQAALAADLQKLLAALEYERRTGFGNVVGSIERVPVADWAGRQLLNAAGQLQAQPSAAHACVAAAQRLRRYAGAGAAERQAAVAAAEAAAQAALQVAQVGARTLAGRQGRYAPPQAASAAPAAPGAQLQPPPPLHRAPPQGPQAQQQWRQQQPVQLQQPADAAGTAAPSAATHVAGAAWASSAVPAQGPAAAATGAGGSVTAAVTEAAGPAAVAAGPAAPDLDLDAAAEEAHAEESGQQRHTPEGEEYVMQGNRRVKASTVAFRRSFAEAAAAAEAAAEATAARGGQAPLAALLAAGGEQRTADWLRLRERRLTASAFSKAIGLFSGASRRSRRSVLLQGIAGCCRLQGASQRRPAACAPTLQGCSSARRCPIAYHKLAAAVSASRAVLTLLGRRTRLLPSPCRRPAAAVGGEGWHGGTLCGQRCHCLGHVGRAQGPGRVPGSHGAAHRLVHVPGWVGWRS